MKPTNLILILLAATTPVTSMPVLILFKSNRIPPTTKGQDISMQNTTSPKVRIPTSTYPAFADIIQSIQDFSSGTGKEELARIGSHFANWTEAEIEDRYQALREQYDEDCYTRKEGREL
jgi:hypothetical protein